ncbi:hypothetical protein [Paracoccus sp. R86501]|uniref:hypothetical protein n=1 Tax=Paracoccus sp. R86501 TaxID=3101711 RepID=UPI00366A8618
MTQATAKRATIGQKSVAWPEAHSRHHWRIDALTDQIDIQYKCADITRHEAFAMPFRPNVVNKTLMKAA